LRRWHRDLATEVMPARGIETPAGLLAAAGVET
jgi:hypothetical protein